MLEKTYRPEEVEARQYERWEDSGAFAARPAEEELSLIHI